MANLENKDNNYENKKHSSSSKTQKPLKEEVKEIAKETLHAVENPVETVEILANQATEDVQNVKWWVRTLLVLFWTTVCIFFLGFIIINLPVTKRWAGNQALELLNKDFKAEMKTEDIAVNFFGDVSIKGLKIKDYRGKEFFQVEELKANTDWFALAKNAIAGKGTSLSFSSIKLTQPVVKVITYEGDSISNFVRYIANFDDGKERDPNKPPFQMDARIVLEEGTVSIINENSSGDQGKWLDAKRLNLVASRVKINGQDVYAQVNRLSFETQRWGKKHWVDTFSADLMLSNEALTLSDLTLNTSHTLLQGNLKFHLNKGSWADFTDKVKWEMQLKYGSEISGHDISYFVKDWDNAHTFKMSGEMSGPLNDFHLTDFVISDAKMNISTPNVHFYQLLGGNFTIKSNLLSARMNYPELRAALPRFISQKMGNFADAFGDIHFKGGVVVQPTKVDVTNAELITSVGQANITQFQLAHLNHIAPSYKGSVQMKNFNVAAITKNEAVGMLSGNFNLEGQGVDVNTLKIRTKSTIQEIEILNHTIKNIYLDGILDHRIYTGIAHIEDAPLKGKVDGRINFQTSRIKADVEAQMNHLHLHYFTKTKTPQIIKGSMKGKIEMSNLDDLVMEAALYDAAFANGKSRYALDQAKVNISYQEGNRIVSVIAPQFINGRITGKYQLSDLGAMFQNGLDKVLVDPQPRKIYKNQFFNFEAEVSEALTKFFLPELKLPRGAFVNGAYDGTLNNLVLNLDVKEGEYSLSDEKEMALLAEAIPNLDFANDESEKPKSLPNNKLTITGMALRINTANVDEQLFLRVDDLRYNQQQFKNLSVVGKKSMEDQLAITTQFQHGTIGEDQEVELKNYAFSLNQTTNKMGDYVLKFDNTSVDFNGVVWAVDTSEEKSHSIVYRKKTGDIELENLRIYSDDSELFISKGIFQSGKDYHFIVDMKNLSLAKLMQMQKSGNTMNLAGIANGTAEIKMEKGELEPHANIEVQSVTMNGDVMGNVFLTVKDSDKENIFDIEGRVVSTGFFGSNSLTVSGILDNSKAKTELDVKADLLDFDLKFANQFVKGIFSNLRGLANGELHISGQLDDLDYNGDIALKNLGLKLDFTGVDYSLEDTVVSLLKGSAILNDIQVKDSRNISKGSISGAIYFETLSSMAVELIMRADNLLLLNTTQSDFDLFWGRVFGQGDLYVSGPVSSLSIQTPNMLALNNSVFTFNANSTSTVEEFKMLQFLKEEKDGSVRRVEQKASANMRVNFNVFVDEGTSVNVLVGDDIGNISVRGKAERLNFQMQRNGGISMDGGFTVGHGTFTSKAVLNKTFQIVKGSNISWSGNPMTPNLDITANYMRTVANTGEYLGIGSIPPINLVLQTKITQSLINPKIELDVVADEVSSQIKETLNAKLNQNDEKLLQFGSILLLNRFNTSDASTSVVNIAQNTGYDLLFKQLGSVLNTISNEFQIDLNYVRGDASSNMGDRASAGVSLDISPRITLKTGFGIPLTRGTEYTTNNFLSGEGTLEYDASKQNDGSLVLRAYSKPMNIGMNGTGVIGNMNQAYGVGIVHTRSFDSLFKRKNKKKATEKINDTVENTDK